MKKKVISVLLTACMLLGMTACGNNAKTSEVSSSDAAKESEMKESEAQETTEEAPEMKDPVTITYRYMNGAGEQQYTEKVEEKLNGMLKEMEGYEHISIDLVPGTSAYATEFTLAQANGDQIDLFNTFGLDFSSLVKDGDVMELDDLLAEYPGITSELPEWLINYGKMYGTQYYIPTYQQAAKLAFLFMPVEYLDMYYEATGATREDISNTIQNGTIEEKLDMYESMCRTVQEETGLSTKYLRQVQFPLYWSNVDDIDNDNGNLILREGDDAPVYWPMTEEYKTIMKRHNEWYKDGLMPAPDTTTGANDFTSDTSVIFDCSTNACSEEAFAAQRSTEEVTVDAIRFTSHAYIPSKYAAGGNAIYTDCEHPEEAMMIIELLMTEKGTEFYNTLVWGLEGTHYEWVDESIPRIKTLEFDGTQGDATTTYTAWNWNTGNVFNCWLNQSSTSDTHLKYIEEEIHEGADTKSSPATGITWDLSSVADQVAQCKAVDGEFFKTLYAADDFDARYAEYVQKLEAAGVQDIIDCVTEQYQAHIASK